MSRVATAAFLIFLAGVVPGLSHAFTLNMELDWFCNGFNEGNDGSVAVFLNKNGTFTTSGGGSGTWGTRMVRGKGMGYLSYDVGCYPLYSVDLTTGEIIYDCRDGATLGPNGWPDARDYSCGRTRVLNRLIADPSDAEAGGDPTGDWLNK